MKKKFEKPQLDIVILSAEDIITGSGGVEDPYPGADQDSDPE